MSDPQRSLATLLFTDIVGSTELRRGNMEGATAAYERAVAADSTFPLALFRLSLVCAWENPDPTCGGREYGARAMALLDRLPPRAATLMRASHDQLGPLRELLRKSPDDAEAWKVLGEIYLHAPGWALIIDRHEEAERAFHRAIELDPGSRCTTGTRSATHSGGRTALARSR